MKAGAFWDLKKLSDNELLQGLHLIVGGERRAIAQVVAHLAEVEERRLELKVGCSSLFDYCLRRLALSEGEAFRRVTAARLARRFPVIFGLLAQGDLHLCALCELRDALTRDNHAALLAEASRKTKKQVKELVAQRFPKPDAPSTLRRLPAPVTISSERLVVPHADSPAPVAPIPPAPAPLPAAKPPTAPAVVEPLREDRYRLQLSASSALKRKLERARDLMSHSNPSGDLAIVVERALDLMIDKLERDRFAKTRRPRADAKEHPDKRRVSNATRRQVVARDGLQCSYVSPDGERCPSTKFLQFHHEHAWARGGPTQTGNVRILCRAHNRLLAEQDFGRQKMAGAIAERRSKREPPSG